MVTKIIIKQGKRIFFVLVKSKLFCNLKKKTNKQKLQKSSKITILLKNKKFANVCHFENSINARRIRKESGKGRDSSSTQKNFKQKLVKNRRPFTAPKDSKFWKKWGDVESIEECKEMKKLFKQKWEEMERIAANLKTLEKRPLNATDSVMRYVHYQEKTDLMKKKRIEFHECQEEAAVMKAIVNNFLEKVKNSTKSNDSVVS